MEPIQEGKNELSIQLARKPRTRIVNMRRREEKEGEVKLDPT